MSIQNFYHDWFEALDYTLLEDRKARALAKDSPGMGMRGRLSTLGSVLPQSLSAQHNLTAMLPIEIDAEISASLSPTVVQIDSPHRIPAALRAPFETGEKALLLVDPQHKKTISATLRTWHDTALIADIPPAPGLRKRGDRLLVMFPVSPQQRYVMQTLVGEVYLDRLILQYQDPRYNVRYPIPLAAPVHVYLMPETLSTALEHQQVSLMRCFSLPPKKFFSEAVEGSIVDQCYETDTETLSPYMPLLETTAGFACRLRDLSTGGACLTCDSVQQPDTLPHRLLWAHINLPIEIAFHTWYLTLKPLGVVCAVRPTDQGWTLHVRFVKRLPHEIATLFTHLASDKYLSKSNLIF